MIILEKLIKFSQSNILEQVHFYHIIIIGKFGDFLRLGDELLTYGLAFFQSF